MGEAKELLQAMEVKLSKMTDSARSPKPLSFLERWAARRLAARAAKSKYGVVGGVRTTDPTDLGNELAGATELVTAARNAHRNDAEELLQIMEAKFKEMAALSRTAPADARTLGYQIKGANEMLNYSCRAYHIIQSKRKRATH